MITEVFYFPDRGCHVDFFVIQGEKLMAWLGIVHFLNLSELAYTN